MAKQKMDDSWDNVKAAIRRTWGEDLSDSDLDKGRRDLNKMVEIIHQNTGEEKAKIRGLMSAIL